MKRNKSSSNNLYYCFTLLSTMQNFHRGPIPIWRHNTRCYIAIQKADSVLIFVHGFNGHATDSWNQFESCFRKDIKFCHTDIYFYGYDSMSVQTESSAITFQKFVEKILTNPYRRIVISAHSLGAVVARRAMLNAYHDNKNWVDYTRLVLFAPAHNGSMVPGFIAELLYGFLRFITIAVRFQLPAIDNLKEGSSVISQLIEDTKYCLSSGNGNFTIAFSVLWAGREKVVVNKRFCNDPTAEQEDNLDHTAICKTLADYQKPYELIYKAL